jgi:hypothetical protein
MEPFDNFNPDVPMSVKMRRAREAIWRMAPEDRIYLLVKAGLMTEEEYKEAIERYREKEARRRKPRSRRKMSPNKSGRVKND